MPARGRRFPSSTHSPSTLADGGAERYSPALLEEHGMLARGLLKAYFPEKWSGLGEIAPGKNAFVIAEHLSGGLNAYSTATTGANQYSYASAVTTASHNSIPDYAESWLIDPSDLFLGFYPIAHRNEGKELLRRIAQLSEQEYDDDEPAPSGAVIDQIYALIREVNKLMSGSLPEGTVSTFYGEVSVTWRSGDNIVRLACLPNRPYILQIGNLSQPLGSYQLRLDPSPHEIAAQLDLFNREAAR